ncbi:MAG: Flp family type IVb pilin [Alphaproteobacteria bacterium]
MPATTHEHAIIRFCRDARGATAIEYALIAAGIALAIVAAVTALGVALNASYSKFAGI